MSVYLRWDKFADGRVPEHTTARIRQDLGVGSYFWHGGQRWKIVERADARELGFERVLPGAVAFMCVPAPRIRFRGERGDVELFATTPTTVLLEFLPHHEMTGSIKAVHDDPSFPHDAWEAFDKDALRAWVAENYPAWLRPLPPR